MILLFPDVLLIFFNHSLFQPLVDSYKATIGLLKALRTEIERQQLSLGNERVQKR